MRTLAVTSVVLILAGLAAADVTFIERTKESRTAILKASDSKKPRMNAVSLKGRMVKFAETDEQAGKQVHISIFDGEKQSQKDANPLNQTYAELDAAYLTKRVESTKTRVADFESKLPTIPEDRKPKLTRYIWLTKKVLGLLPEAPKVEMTRTGEKQKVGIYDCERIVIKEANEKGELEVVFDCWMTEQVSGWSSYLEFFSAYKAFSPAVLEKMKELKGFQMKGTFIPFYFDGDGYLESNEFENSDVKDAELAAAEFEVPATYKNTTKK